MKKLLLGSIALTVFSISIILFQISCKKEATAQAPSTNTLAPATTTTLGGVIVDGKTITVDGSGKISIAGPDLILYSQGDDDQEIWKTNIDGSNQQKINIVLPVGYKIESNSDGGQIKMSANKKLIIFKGRQISTSHNALFSCAIDGSNVTKLIDNIGTSFTID